LVDKNLNNEKAPQGAFFVSTIYCMNIEKKLIQLIYEAYDNEVKKNDFKEIANSFSNQNKKPKPESSVYFKEIQIQVLNNEIIENIENYLRSYKLKFSKRNNIYIVNNVPADPVVIQLALNLPPEWIAIKGTEDGGVIKNIKIKGTEYRARALLDNIE